MGRLRVYEASLKGDILKLENKGVEIIEVRKSSIASVESNRIKNTNRKGSLPFGIVFSVIGGVFLTVSLLFFFIAMIYSIINLSTGGTTEELAQVAFGLNITALVFLGLCLPFLIIGIINVVVGIKKKIQARYNGLVRLIIKNEYQRVLFNGYIEDKEDVDTILAEIKK